jgi:dCMP deaminase
MTDQRTWDIRFLELAQLVGSWSKDPTTQVGAVIVDDKHRVVSVGYNGFPRGVHDDEDRLVDRERKLHMTMHAEQNAILFAQRSIEGCTLYTWPIPCCAQCAGMVIQSGIKRVVSLDATLRPDWRKSFDIANTMFKEANVETDYETI